MCILAYLAVAPASPGSWMEAQQEVRPFAGGVDLVQCVYIRCLSQPSQRTASTTSEGCLARSTRATDGGGRNRWSASASIGVQFDRSSDCGIELTWQAPHTDRSDLPTAAQVERPQRAEPAQPRGPHRRCRVHPIGEIEEATARSRDGHADVGDTGEAHQEEMRRLGQPSTTHARRSRGIERTRSSHSSSCAHCPLQRQQALVTNLAASGDGGTRRWRTGPPRSRAKANRVGRPRCGPQPRQPAAASALSVSARGSLLTFRLVRLDKLAPTTPKPKGDSSPQERRLRDASSGLQLHRWPSALSSM